MPSWTMSTIVFAILLTRSFLRVFTIPSLKHL